MRILILSCNTGEGHNSTARAITLAAEAKGHTVETWDALSFWPAGTDRFLCNGQVFLYKNAPELFGAGYRFFELVAEYQQGRREAGKGKLTEEALALLVKRPSEKLYEDICKGNFDAVISVHVFASLMHTEIRRQNGEEHPAYFVATDYTCSPGVHMSDFDGCFIPTEGLTEEFVSFGVKREKIIPSGIPVRSDFYESIPKAEAKARLGLPADKRVALLMGGSMGCGPLAHTVTAMLRALPEDVVLAAVCGRNEKLYEKLSALPEAGKTLFPVGFTKEIPVYMDASELIVTKAGGLSTTEAAVKHLPIVFLDAIPGLEVHNRDYFAERGYAVYHDDPEGVAALVGRLLSEPETLAAMRKRMEDCFTHRSAEEIVERVCRDVAAANATPPEEYQAL